ncbi:hypothetical protein [Cytobacillus massiliigabonensis]|uniref:hypothetical protein n=1 Tax=Cytobacillus massiliigabonensis TaxID=1871011 RepID=UPI000C818533|nr:hypothetical protein [Cytobacillus massiliigabonensis]
MTSNELNARIDELWAKTKAGELPREERFAAIERLTDEYITATGKRPEPAQLDRLATLCLYEEVTDPNEHKMLHEPEPVLSDRQYDRRKKREWWREEIEVGAAHVTGKRATMFKDENDTLQCAKTTYYLR